MINAKGYKPEELGITDEKITSLPGIRFYSARETDEIRVYGLYNFKNADMTMRLPPEVAETVSPAVARLN